MAGPRLPRARPRHHPLRRVGRRSCAYLEQWTAPTKRPHAGRAGQLRPRARGLPAAASARCRPSTPASCSRTSSDAATCAARTASPPRSPELARRRAGRGDPGQRRPAPGARERAPRRADALGRRADPAPAAPAAARRRSSSGRSAASWSTPTASPSPRTTAARAARAPPPPRRGLPAVRRLRLETHRHHRGGRPARDQAAAIDRLSTAGVFTTLAMTVAMGVNDDEIGDVLRVALETPYVGGVSTSRSSACGARRRSTRWTASPTPACSPGWGPRPAAW